MLLYFSGQGAGRVFWPVFAGLARLLIAGMGGWLIVARFGLGLHTLFAAVAIAAIAYGGITADRDHARTMAAGAVGNRGSRTAQCFLAG